MARRQFRPTAEQRGVVDGMIALGIPEADIAHLIINPETGKPITEPTLRKHFAAEIATGATKLKAEVGRLVVNTMLGRKAKVRDKDGKPVIDQATGLELEVPLGLEDDRARATLIIFFCKTRMGWKETSVHEHANKDGKPFIFQVNPVDAKL